MKRVNTKALLLNLFIIIGISKTKENPIKPLQQLETSDEDKPAKGSKTLDRLTTKMQNNAIIIKLDNLLSYFSPLFAL